MQSSPPRHIVAACALVSNEAGEILLVKTKRRGWEFPGGQVEAGETLTQALRREIVEESGVIAEIGRLCVINSNLSRAIVVFGFRASYVSGQLTPSIDETLEAQWVLPEKVPSMITHAVNLQRAHDMMAAQTSIVYRAYTIDPYTLVETRELESNL